MTQFKIFDNPTNEPTREITHGDYDDNAYVAISISDILENALRDNPKFQDLTRKEKDLILFTLRNLSHKLCRIVNGQPLFHDHWIDIKGYTQRLLDNVL